MDWKILSIHWVTKSKGKKKLHMNILIKRDLQKNKVYKTIHYKMTVGKFLKEIKNCTK